MSQTDISKQAHAWVDAGARVLDVRTPEEFAKGHIPQAVNIPVQELAARMTEVPPGKLVVHCAAGVRSAAAVKLLQQAGHTELLDLGSFSAW